MTMNDADQRDRPGGGILIVDDTAPHRRVSIAKLTRHGYRVRTDDVLDRDPRH